MNEYKKPKEIFSIDQDERHVLPSGIFPWIYIRTIRCELQKNIYISLDL